MAETIRGIEDRRFEPFDKLPKPEKLRVARREYADVISADVPFQRQAKKAYRFYAGDQYTTEEKKALEAAGRPALVCNLVKTTIELVKGVNDQNRVQAHAIPTEKGDRLLCDILNDVYEKVRDIEDMEAVEDDALENNAISGKGFVAVDIAPDPKRPGEIRIPIVSIPTDEVREDPGGRFVYWAKWLSFEDFAIQYPDFVDDLEEIMSGESVGDFAEWDGLLDEYSDNFGDTPIDEDYSNVLDNGYYDREKGHVKVVHKEYWAVYDRYYGVNPETGMLEEFDPEKLSLLKKMIPGFQYQVVKDKKVKWFQFIGHKVLYDGDSPIPYDGFSIVREHAYKDKSNKEISYFGIVKDMIDPQREANKRWSQTLNLYLKQSQGGHFVEKSAIEDATQWANSINAPGEDTIVADGAISQGRIRDKHIPEFPTGALQLNEFAQDLLKKISGVNPDLLGLDRGRQEPGVVVKMRQQQGLTLLNNIFTNHKRLIKQVAERVYAIIMAYMPESQIRRILGDTEKYIFRGNLIADLENKIVAPIRNVKDLKYNIYIKDSPANMTKTIAHLAIFLDMMSKGFPVDPETVIEKLDITQAEKQKWIAYVKNMQMSQMQMAETQLQMKSEQNAGKLQVAQQKVQVEAMKAELDRQTSMDKLRQKELKDRREFEIALAKLDNDSRKMVMGLIEKLSSRPMQLPEPASGPTANRGYM